MGGLKIFRGEGGGEQGSESFIAGKKKDE